MLKGTLPVLGPHLQNRSVVEKMEKIKSFNSIFTYSHVVLHFDSLN